MPAPSPHQALEQAATSDRARKSCRNPKRRSKLELCHFAASRKLFAELRVELAKPLSPFFLFFSFWFAHLASPMLQIIAVRRPEPHVASIRSSPL